MLFPSTQAPINGIPSLTDAQIYQLYNFYLHRDPDGTELASERDNALKYSAAGIERQIANRAGNVAGSGIRGDEGAAPLTVPATVVAHVLSGVPSGAVSGGNTAVPVGPTGNVLSVQGPPLYAPYDGAPTSAPFAASGFSMTTLLMLAAMGIAVFLLVKR